VTYQAALLSRSKKSPPLLELDIDRSLLFAPLSEDVDFLSKDPRAPRYTV